MTCAPSATRPTCPAMAVPLIVSVRLAPTVMFPPAEIVPAPIEASVALWTFRTPTAAPMPTTPIDTVPTMMSNAIRSCARTVIEPPAIRLPCVSAIVPVSAVEATAASAPPVGVAPVRVEALLSASRCPFSFLPVPDEPLESWLLKSPPLPSAAPVLPPNADEPPLSLRLSDEVLSVE